MTLKTPTLAQFKTFSRDIAPAARAVLMARVFAQMERERVDAYIRPIFDRYRFEYGPDITRGHLTGLIPHMKDLYLCEDEPGLKAYYADCDDAHRAHGFTGPAGHCPALVAENMAMRTESLLIDLSTDLFGFKSNELFGDNRKKCLDILIGAALKAEKDAA
jgi:hypothetical protein